MSVVGSREMVMFGTEYTSQCQTIVCLANGIAKQPDSPFCHSVDHSGLNSRMPGFRQNEKFSRPSCQILFHRNDWIPVDSCRNQGGTDKTLGGLTKMGTTTQVQAS